MLSFWQEYPETSLCFLGVLLVLLQTWYLKKDFFRPTNIYFFVQLLTLGIAYLKVNPLMSDFKVNTWCAWLGALVCFGLGSASFYCLKKNTDKITTGSCDTRYYNWNYHFVISCILTGVFLIGIGGMVAKVGTLTVLSSDVAKWSGADVDWGIYSLFVASSPLLMLFWGLLAFKKINEVGKFRIVARILLVLVPILSIMVYPSRGTFLMSVGFLVIFWNYFKSKISVRLIVFLLGLGFAVFMGAASLRAQYGGTSLANLALKKAIELPYNYIANNFWNLDYALNPPADTQLHPHTFGIDFLATAFEYFRVPGSVKNALHWDTMFNESVRKTYGYNTTGYLWEVYKDWSWAGCTLIPFLISFCMAYFYEKTINSKSPRNWMLYVLFLYYIGWSFFCAGFKIPTFWLWVYIILLSTKFCESNKKAIVQCV